MLRDLIAGSGAAESVDAARLFVVTRRADAGAGRPAARAPLLPPRRRPGVGRRADVRRARRRATGRRRRRRCSSPGPACRSPGCGPATTSAPCSRPPPSPGSTRMRERLALTAPVGRVPGLPVGAARAAVGQPGRRGRAGASPPSRRRRCGRPAAAGWPSAPWSSRSWSRCRRRLRPLPVGDRPPPLPDPRLGRRCRTAPRAGWTRPRRSTRAASPAPSPTSSWCSRSCWPRWRGC